MTTASPGPGYLDPNHDNFDPTEYLRRKRSAGQERMGGGRDPGVGEADPTELIVDSGTLVEIAKEVLGEKAVQSRQAAEAIKEGWRTVPADQRWPLSNLVSKTNRRAFRQMVENVYAGKREQVLTPQPNGDWQLIGFDVTIERGVRRVPKHLDGGRKTFDEVPVRWLVLQMQWVDMNGAEDIVYRNGAPSNDADLSPAVAKMFAKLAEQGLMRPPDDETRRENERLREANEALVVENASLRHDINKIEETVEERFAALEARLATPAPAPVAVPQEAATESAGVPVDDVTDDDFDEDVLALVRGTLADIDAGLNSGNFDRRLDQVADAEAYAQGDKGPRSGAMSRIEARAKAVHSAPPVAEPAEDEPVTRRRKDGAPPTAQA